MYYNLESTLSCMYLFIFRTVKQNGQREIPVFVPLSILLCSLPVNSVPGLSLSHRIPVFIYSFFPQYAVKFVP